MITSYGTVSRDGSEAIFPLKIFIDQVLEGEQNQKILQSTFSPASFSQWLLGKQGLGETLHIPCIQNFKNQSIF